MMALRSLLLPMLDPNRGRIRIFDGRVSWKVDSGLSTPGAMASRRHFPCLVDHMYFSLLSFCILGVTVQSVSAAEVHLAWDQVDDARIDHYQIFIGYTPEQYIHRLETTSTSLKVAGLGTGTTYFFAVRACDRSGLLCSAISNIIGATIPSEQIPTPPSNDQATSPNPASVIGANFQMEIGEINVNEMWQRINFQQAFMDPVVVIKPLSFYGAHPDVIRVNGIDQQGFWVRIQEWDYRDAGHGFDLANYLVIERGRHQLDNGTWLEAGSILTTATNAYEYQGFSQGFASPPVVLASVSSFNATQAVSARLNRVNHSGFFVGLLDQDAYDVRSVPERIDFVAWESSFGVMQNLRFEVGRMGEAVNAMTYRVFYQEDYASTPFFMGDLLTTNNVDGANLRINFIDSDRVDFWVQGAKEVDMTTSQVSEDVGYFILDVEN